MMLLKTSEMFQIPLMFVHGWICNVEF